MTCMMLSRSCAEEYDLNTPSAKLNHRRFRALLKKLRRKKIRQKAAQERDRLLQVEEKVPLSPCQEEQEQEEQEKQRQHELWLEREAEAQREFKQRCRLEEERETVLANRAKGASQEESLEKVLAQLPVASPSLPPTSREESWHNPPAPSTYAPAEPCPFYLKTGACRFGDWCSRAHPRPVVSRTLLLRGLYSHLSLEQHHGDDSLETDERELQAHFEAFFWDVLEELRRAGTVCQLRVCRNLEPHLRGNVYVQYSSEEEARRALTMLNGRWYAGRPVSCEFSPVDRWKTAVCGLFFRRACPKGRGCNFLHVFRNPTDECWHESRSPPPQRQHSHSPVAKRRRQSRSPHRSHKRSRASRSRSKSKDQKKRRRHELRSRSRSRSRKSVTRSSRSKHR
ncbi:U2 small nuclear ribonucleoprotein auxiliary factor 35 kDa subunit-related protein 2-like isoform X1 [Dermacentor albipictus]|uniref:U2 small nuclear ribonucleoprotein auxiliary factor 35 kDa subunit-related protein 2-like isoform X1 n=1 Tax=Dermacentor albipictus TaxID=60249 RepID=UPI0038FCEC63